MRLAHWSHPRVQCADTCLGKEALQEDEFAEQTELPFSSEKRFLLEQVGEAPKLQGNRLDRRTVLHDHALAHCNGEMVKLAVKRGCGRGDFEELQSFPAEGTGGNEREFRQFGRDKRASMNLQPYTDAIQCAIAKHLDVGRV